MIFGMIIKAENHGSDLRVWVELRGFEPLTPSMRTTGGRVVQVRSGMSDVRISLDGYGHRRRGCCTLVLHPDALTLKCQQAQTHGSGGGRPPTTLSPLPRPPRSAIFAPSSATSPI
jgi:hypothetical protein